MRLHTGFVTLSFALFACSSVLASDTPRPAVGVVLSNGQFQVAHAPGSGTATVLNGDEVESSASASRVLLKNGSELALAPHSSGSFYGDHANLRDGQLRVKSTAPFYLTARNFVVTPSAGTQITLETSGAKLIVNVASGDASITSSKGETLARMTPGATLAFDSMPGVAAAGVAGDSAPFNASDANVRLLGVLITENGHYLVRDRYSNSVFEVAGEFPNKLVDHLVSVDGTWIGNQKSSIPQVDHVMKARNIVPSDATVGAPCLPDGAGGALKQIVLNGTVTKYQNHFLVKDPNLGTYEVVGDVGDKEVGKGLHEKGFILPQRTAVQPADKVVYIEQRRLVLAASPCVGLLVGSTMITSGMLTLPRNTEGQARSVTKPISF